MEYLIVGVMVILVIYLDYKRGKHVAICPTCQVPVEQGKVCAICGSNNDPKMGVPKFCETCICMTPRSRTGRCLGCSGNAGAKKA